MIKPIDSIRWFHSIDLGNGQITQGHKPNELLRMEAEIIFSYSVQGKTVMDVGAWDGFFSFEAEQRGAQRVLATDHFCWSGPGWGTKDGFDTARHFLRSRVGSLDIDVMDITVERTGEHDVVLFLGVLYHLKHPFLGLEKMAAVARECLIVETLLDFYDLDRPAGAFYPGKEKGNDPTNWWGLNQHAVIAMLKCLDFPKVLFALHPSSNPAIPDSMRGIFHAIRG